MVLAVLPCILSVVRSSLLYRFLDDERPIVVPTHRLIERWLHPSTLRKPTVDIVRTLHTELESIQYSGKILIQREGRFTFVPLFRSFPCTVDQHIGRRPFSTTHGRQQTIGISGRDGQRG